jgi:hypothetical protein
MLYSSLKTIGSLFTLLMMISMFNSQIVFADTNLVFNEIRFKQLEANKELSARRDQVHSSSGQALINAIENIKKNSEQNALSKEFLLMQSVARLRSLLLENKRLSNSDRQIYLEQLHLLSEIKSETQRKLNDGRYYQIVKAFPFDKAAISSIQIVRDTEKSNEVLELLENYQYSELSKMLPTDKRHQIKILKRALEKLEPSKMQPLLNWSNNAANNQLVFPAETIFLISIVAGDLPKAVESLIRDKNISFHHYFDKISTRFSLQQRFEFFKHVSNLKSYASASMYQISRLDISVERKKRFFLDALGRPNSGSSAAHILSDEMTDDEVDKLVEIAKNSPDLLTQKNAVLALLLSQSSLAKRKTSQLYHAKLLEPKLTKEIAPWFE